ncbi:MAG: hypothetical protein Q8R28_13640 [Dehalococcoidia bacterium]|nr:hypothetical protein [Dehalococcoidia bacterium]
MELTGDLENIIEIRDADINVAELMARIRESLGKREPLAKEVDSLVFDPGLGGSLSLEAGLKQSLQQVGLTYDKIYVGDQLRAPTTWKDRLVDSIRRPLHQLVRFYADLLSSKQVTFNSATASALTNLSKQLQQEQKERETELGRLKGEIDELRQTIDQLRCQSNRWHE